MLNQLSMKFILLINVKMPTIVGILTFISMIHTTSESLKEIKVFFAAFKFSWAVETLCSVELSMIKSFITSEPGYLIFWLNNCFGKACFYRLLIFFKHKMFKKNLSWIPPDTLGITGIKHSVLLHSWKKWNRIFYPWVIEDDQQSGKQLVLTFCRRPDLGPSCSKRFSVEKRQRINVCMDGLLYYCHPLNVQPVW